MRSRSSRRAPYLLWRRTRSHQREEPAVEEPIADKTEEKKGGKLPSAAGLPAPFRRLSSNIGALTGMTPRATPSPVVPKLTPSGERRAPRVCSLVCVHPPPQSLLAAYP